MKNRKLSLSVFAGLFAALLTLSSIAIDSARAQSVTHTCGKDVAGGNDYFWCIDKTIGSRNADVLYYMHGLSGSEHAWKTFSDNQRIKREWDKMGVDAPTVLTVSFGGGWLLSEVELTSLKSPLHTAFVNEIMPALEAKIGGIKGRRLLKGESMGGFNGSQLLLKNGNLFARAALVCPAISIVGPHSPQTEIDDFIARNQPHISPDIVSDLRDWSRAEFPTEQDWANHNALNLVSSAPIANHDIYVSCGQQDEFGFFEGAELFSSLAQKAGANVTWEPLTGGHCVANASAIARFLAP